MHFARFYVSLKALWHRLQSFRTNKASTTKTPSNRPHSNYKITPKRPNALFDLLYFINPISFKLDAQEISQSLKQNTLKIKYQSYQKATGLVLPENMTITAINANELTTLNLNLKSVNLDQPIRFPFSIPKGFKAIELK